MRFEPMPANTFPEFIDAYFERCCARCPKLRGIAGKWTFEDLLPGMSDFDTRLIFADDVSLPEWAEMSLAVGEVHTGLAREYPHWARILEHLPGLNLTHAEMTDPVFYYPEFQQWTYYKGDQQVLGSVQSYLAEKPWSARDELFHLKKFATFYGPYQRGIDPPVNMGPWENKYALHSRFMHYFTPAVQSGLSLALRQNVRGKLDALRAARDVFPNPEVVDMVLDAVAQHYEIAEDYAEPNLTQIERQLEGYLGAVYALLGHQVTLIHIDPSDTPQRLKAHIAAAPVDVAERYYEGAKFSRFMKGRLLFYATDILWFDTRWVIRNEIVRMRKNFYDTPLTAYGGLFFPDDPSPEAVLDRLKDDGKLSGDVCESAKQFARVLDTPFTDQQRRERARQIASLFEPVQFMLETLGRDIVAYFRAQDVNRAGRVAGPSS
jgi:hypothetical protein